MELGGVYMTTELVLLQYDTHGSFHVYIEVFIVE